MSYSFWPPTRASVAWGANRERECHTPEVQLDADKHPALPSGQISAGSFFRQEIKKKTSREGELLFPRPPAVGKPRMSECMGKGVVFKVPKVSNLRIKLLDFLSVLG